MARSITEKILFAGAMAVLLLHFAVWTIADQRKPATSGAAFAYEND